MTLTFTQGHNYVSNLTNVLLVTQYNYLGQYLSYDIQTWHDGRRMHGMYMHVHAFRDDLDLDARSQWIRRQSKNNNNQISVELSRQVRNQ